MKKLLSLLSVITIAGSGISGVVANSPHKKQETKLTNNRIKRNNNNNGEIYWINSVTNFKKETDVPYPITAMYTFTKNEGDRKIGDIYFGTTKGVYLRKAGQSTTTKMAGIDESIVLIQKYNSEYDPGSVHVITNDGDVYYINRSGNVIRQTDVPYPATTMYTFTKNEGDRKIGDIYFGTTKGIYLRKAGQSTTTKMAGIDESIVLIQKYNSEYDPGSVYVITNDGDVYYINRSDNVIRQTDVPYPITAMYTFTKNEGDRKIGDIYFGTTKGVYLRKAGESTTTKMAGIDESIVLIQKYNSEYDPGSVHVITNDGDVYYINRSGNVIRQTDVPYPATTMYTFTKNEGDRKIGDIYFGTTKGIYLRKAGESTTTKMAGIDESIVLIQKYNSEYDPGSVHVITLNKNILERTQDKLTSLNSEITDLTNKLNDYDKEISNLEQEKIKSTQDKKILIGEKNKLESLNKELEEQINELKTNINLQTSKLIINILNEHTKQLETTKSDNQKNIDKKDVEISKLTNDTKSIEDKIIVLKAEKQNLNKKINQINDEKKELEKDIKLYKLDNSGLIEEIKKQEINFWKDYQLQYEEIKNLKIQLKQCQEKV